MGESRGGEGRAEGPTVIQALSSILRQYRNDGREVGTITVRRLTEGIVSLEVQIHGESEPEEVVTFGFEDSDDLAVPFPIRDDSDRPGGS
jgi:hypothetical protein